MPCDEASPPGTSSPPLVLSEAPVLTVEELEGGCSPCTVFVDAQELMDSQADDDEPRASQNHPLEALLL